MICLIQRVTESQVSINNKVMGFIGQGLMALTGFEKHDDKASVNKMIEKVLNYRVFADDNDKMNLSLRDVSGGLLLIPQFTLSADTNKGRRPSFASAAPPQLGEALFTYYIDVARQKHSPVEAGVFGADMQVSLTNDGPATFWLQV